MNSLATLPVLLALFSSGSWAQHSAQDPEPGAGHGSGHDSEGLSKPVHPNRLQHASSPYLLQHAHNPVDWYEWGDEALEKARTEDKPIFLSVGYSACHWCHVMAHESFENEEIAALMNEYFVNVKVDREERPDIDRIYMAAAQRIMQEGGGWPLSVWMTPDLKPFYAGTYFPPTEKYGRPGFREICEHTNRLWTEKRDLLERYGESILNDLRLQNTATSGKDTLPGPEIWARVVEVAKERFDEVHGGFGRAPRWSPKFPRCTELVLLLRYGHRVGNEELSEFVEFTLDKMARGGIYDQIGGGFARYSVDRFWTVPHFEKMSYDNSQLAQLYMESWQATGNEDRRRIAREILDYTAREMTSPEGGFYSTTDADSEGHEGKFFVWTPDEVREVCGEDAAVALHYYSVTPGGNFEGKTILTARRSLTETAAALELSIEQAREALERCRDALYEAREKRVHPHLDDKILSSWNGMMLSAFARAAGVFGEPRDLETARSNAEFLLTKMRREDGSLYRTRREGVSRLDGFLEDYVHVANGLIDLYEVDFDVRWLQAAVELFEFACANFTDENGFFVSVRTADQRLPVALSAAQESSLPSDIGVAATVALRLGLLTGRTEWLERTDFVLARFSGALQSYPTAYGQLMIALDFLNAQPKEVYLVGTGEALEAEARKTRTSWPPYRVLAKFPEVSEALVELLPAARGKGLVEGAPTVYVCTRGVCKAPRSLESEDGR